MIITEWLKPAGVLTIGVVTAAALIAFNFVDRSQILKETDARIETVETTTGDVVVRVDGLDKRVTKLERIVGAIVADDMDMDGGGS